MLNLRETWSLAEQGREVALIVDCDCFFSCKEQHGARVVCTRLLRIRLFWRQDKGHAHLVLLVLLQIVHVNATWGCGSVWLGHRLARQGPRRKIV